MAFRSLFSLFPSALRASGNKQNKLLQAINLYIPSKSHDISCLLYDSGSSNVKFPISVS